MLRSFPLHCIVREWRQALAADDRNSAAFQFAHANLAMAWGTTLSEAADPDALLACHLWDSRERVFNYWYQIEKEANDGSEMHWFSSFHRPLREFYEQWIPKDDLNLILCGKPSFALRWPQEFSKEVQAYNRGEYPGWTPDDLYTACVAAKAKKEAKPAEFKSLLDLM